MFTICCLSLVQLKWFGIELRKDDLVLIRNCPPVSALKRFKLERLLKSPTTERDIARAQKAQELGSPS
jgi:hypothetical protein